MKHFLFFLFAGFFAACKAPPEITHASSTTNRNRPASGAPENFDWAHYDYGELPPFAFAQAQDSVWARYGIRTWSVGCEVTPALLQGIKVHNDSLFALLQPKYPGVSEDRIRREIAAFEARSKKQ